MIDNWVLSKEVENKIVEIYINFYYYYSLKIALKVYNFRIVKD